jgi:hypothetical protein
MLLVLQGFPLSSGTKCGLEGLWLLEAFIFFVFLFVFLFVFRLIFNIN